MFFKRVWVICTALVLFTSLVSADEYDKFNTPRFTLFVPKSQAPTTSVSPQGLAQKTVAFVNKTHTELQQIFKADVTETITLKLLSPRDFHKETGAPSWTSAMYYKGQIFAPVNMRNLNVSELQHSLKHEYVHAFVASMSKNKCPAWFDEGLAQLIEGEPNSLLGPALRKWSKKSKPIPLDWMNDGFMGMSKKMVPVAYAQSLFAVRDLAQIKGMDGISNYLKLMGNGASNEGAFREAFGLSLDVFEKSLGHKISRWAASSKRHP